MIINKKRNYKKLIIILLSVLFLFLITIIIIKVHQEVKHQKFLETERQRVRQYTALTDFQNIQEVALYLNCKLIQQEDVEDDNISYRIFMELPIKITENNSSAYNFVENLIKFSAYALKYKNFMIIDNISGDSIVVYCREDKQMIENYYINETENYYEVMKAKDNIENFTELNAVEMEVNSPELQQLLEKKWISNSVNFGTSESTYRDYNIFFDEGIQTRIVGGKVFNLIFTTNYKNPIINNLKTDSSVDDIKNALGEPQFSDSGLIGYKGKNMYVFFYKNQVSIYRIEGYNTDNIAKIIKEKPTDLENEKVFIEQLKNEWKDYDIYEYGNDYVKLQYTLKGLCVKYDTTAKKGIIVYNNYVGKIYGDITLEEIVKNPVEVPNEIIVDNRDLVYEEEKNRINTLDDTTSAYNFTKPGVVLNKSNSFKTYKKNVDDSEVLYNIRFISINNQFPNSELREMMEMGIWYDDYNFIYSTRDRGIFIYNAKERTYSTLIVGEGRFELKEIKGNILYYDDTSVEVNI